MTLSMSCCVVVNVVVVVVVLAAVVVIVFVAFVVGVANDHLKDPTSCKRSS